MKQRLDRYIVENRLTNSRSQAENYIRLGRVTVNGEAIKKCGFIVSTVDKVVLNIPEQYVSRAGLKLASVSNNFHLNFMGKVVLDIGSSTGGFTDYALRHGARMVYAVDVGTDQLHPSLRGNDQIKLYEKTDIRNFIPPETIDIILADVSFISLREILPHVAKTAMNKRTLLVAMVKPQFEAGRNQTNRGVVKNNAVRRRILSDFEIWARQYFSIIDKRDSSISGAKGNVERFYVLKLIKTCSKH